MIVDTLVRLPSIHVMSFAKFAPIIRNRLSFYTESFATTWTQGIYYEENEVTVRNLLDAEWSINKNNNCNNSASRLFIVLA
jgi:hypothetical protein